MHTLTFGDHVVILERCGGRQWYWKRGHRARFVGRVFEIITDGFTDRRGVVMLARMWKRLLT